MKRTRKNIKLYVINWLQCNKDYIIIAIALLIIALIFILSINNVSKKLDNIDKIKQQQINEQLKKEKV